LEHKAMLAAEVDAACRVAKAFLSRTEQTMLRDRIWAVAEKAFDAGRAQSARENPDAADPAESILMTTSAGTTGKSRPPKTP